MPDQDIKKAVRFCVTNIQNGEIFYFEEDRYYIFRNGNRIGAAVSTGQEELNVHELHCFLYIDMSHPY